MKQEYPRFEYLARKQKHVCENNSKEEYSWRILFDGEALDAFADCFNVFRNSVCAFEATTNHGEPNVLWNDAAEMLIQSW